MTEGVVATITGPPPERCADCRFWHETIVADGVIDSVCRRYPPVPMIIMRASGNARVTAWPRPEPHHWCGEFVRAEGAT